MEIVIKIIPIILYFIVGVISLVMAQKSIFSKGFISFHEESAGTSLGNFWEILIKKSKMSFWPNLLFWVVSGKLPTVQKIWREYILERRLNCCVNTCSWNNHFDAIKKDTA